MSAPWSRPTKPCWKRRRRTGRPSPPPTSRCWRPRRCCAGLPPPGRRSGSTSAATPGRSPPWPKSPTPPTPSPTSGPPSEEPDGRLDPCRVDRHRRPVGFVVVGGPWRGDHLGGAAVEVRAGEDARPRQNGLEGLEPTLVVLPRRPLGIPLPPADGPDQGQLELAPVVEALMVGGHGQGEGPQLPRVGERQLLGVAAGSGQLGQELFDPPAGVAEFGGVGSHRGLRGGGRARRRSSSRG